MFTVIMRSKRYDWELVCFCYNVRYKYVQNLIWKTTMKKGYSRN